MANRVVLIMGASGGIGAALAELVAKRGDSVAIVARRKDALDHVAGRCGPDSLAIVGDVTQRESVRRAIDATIARFGHIDTLVNNAGQGMSRKPSALTDADIDLMMAANVRPALYGMQEILPYFKERGAGHVINISSMLGRVPFVVIRSAYCGAKHFLNALTATFRAEVQTTHPGIRFSLVSPGPVRTDFGLNAVYGGHDSRSLPGSQSAEEAAAVIAAVIDSKRPDSYTQQGSRDEVLRYYASLGEDPEQ
jgi:NAD(P)-dependent dehydrogenase (short-subunit alcohol dehydrogenase family)